MILWQTSSIGNQGWDIAEQLYLMIKKIVLKLSVSQTQKSA
jgi:hypothetical protein